MYPIADVASHEQQTYMERNASLDGLKYLLIVLVVLGHFIEPSRYTYDGVCRLYSVIYSFHMPLFVLLSGYFYKQRTLREEWQKCLPLIEVFVLSHIGFILLRDRTITPVNLLTFGAAPSWYIISLVAWRLMSSAALRMMRSDRLFVLSILLAVVTFVAIPKHGDVLSVMRICQFYPYFLFGYLLRQNNWQDTLARYKTVVCSIGLISLAGVLYTSCRLQHVVLFQRDGLLKLAEISGYDVWVILGYRYMLVAWGLLISVSLFLLLRNAAWVQRFALYGRGTLFIYFGQTLLYPLVNRYCCGLTCSLVAVVCAVGVLTYLSTRPVANILMHPVSTILHKS